MSTAPMPEPPLRKVEFVPVIERQALRIIATDPAFLVKWRGRLKPDHFNEPHIQVLFKTVDEYVKAYKILPTLNILYQHLKNHIGTHDNYQGFADYAQALFHEQFSTDEKAVKDCMLAHMKAVDFDRFVLEAARMAADKDYDKIEGRLHELTVRHTDSVPTAAYLSTIEDSVAERVKIEKELKMATPSPWPTLNLKHGGGWQASAVHAFMGPTGSGKSILLVNAGAHDVLQGKNVYHFTFELSDRKTKARYDVCLTGAGHAERIASPDKLDAFFDATKDSRGKLYVIQMSTGTCSTNGVRASINDHIMMGAPKPDVIILDYLTIMMPNDPDNVDMKRDYAKLKVIAEEVRALAMDLDLPILTALQSNRGSTGKEKISKEDIADSYAVMHVLDLVLSINQNDTEKAAGQLRLYAAKVRDFEDAYTIPLEVKYNNLRVAEDPKLTAKYNEAIEKMRTDALAKQATAGIHTSMPAAVTNPDDPSAGLNFLLGMGVNPVKAKNSAQPTQADAAQAAAWGHGHAPPPLVGLPPPIAKPQ
jgi:replicative DNA helicase